ncbi:hypothetical protein F8388_004373 [Cannabis sativa]|uniref:RNase H type-1 domain-containing protein n=1 Tax=Cannabis sativa TaxID=3483 RepID=A0A7J6H9X5_CANSA|nr:hypothetical protein F8388_004373 [Cannabis sativa]
MGWPESDPRVARPMPVTKMAWPESDPRVAWPMSVTKRAWPKSGLQIRSTNVGYEDGLARDYEKGLAKEWSPDLLIQRQLRNLLDQISTLKVVQLMPSKIVARHISTKPMPYSKFPLIRLSTIASFEGITTPFSLYVDGALDSKSLKTGLGAAIISIPKSGASTPIYVEVQALLEGLNWCMAIHLQPSLIVSDCYQLILKVKSSWKDNSALSSLVELVCQSLSYFHNVSLQHILRTDNKEAHQNAREALLRDKDFI